MGVGFRAMRLGQEDAVAAMIRQLPRDTGSDFVPKITGESLRAASDLVQVLVAEDSGLLLGCCTWMPVYSTWRGCKGIYISDLYVMEHARGRKIGERLLKQLSREALKIDAHYIRLEVEHGNTRGAQFYERLGFVRKTDQDNCFLESEALNTLAGELK
jgi:ribosomal protein S18 acetylase RimI-like enzyme